MAGISQVGCVSFEEAIGSQEQNEYRVCGEIARMSVLFSDGDRSHSPSKSAIKVTN